MGVPNVLVVEDEPRLRQLVAKVLRRSGFVVLEAEDGATALRLFGDQAGDIALLVTDIVLPGMNGEQLASTLLERHPGLRVIYMSGFSEEELTSRGAARVGSAYLSKPFTPEVLGMMVEGVLGR